jgi:hypothetical protein
VLDHIERRRFLVQPSGKGPLPGFIRPLDVDLNEGAGQFLRFPGRSRFARPQAHDHVFPPHRLSGMKRDVLDDAVALVEDAEDGDPLRHRRHARLVDARRHRGVGNDRLRGMLLVATAARREREDSQERCGKPVHAYSGIQGS